MKGRWSLDAGRVTRAYDDWHLSEQELRAFLRLASAFSEEGYAARWTRIQHHPGSEDADILDLMDREVDGLIPHQFEWLLGNFCVRDGTTLYEVYLEKALEEVAGFQVGTLPVGEHSPFWREFRDVFHDVFDLDPSPGDVSDVIDLRDLLTHRRGELRTEEAQNRYQTHELEFPDYAVRLTRTRVAECLDSLAASVERIDRVMYGHSWGHQPLTDEQKRRLAEVLGHGRQRSRSRGPRVDPLERGRRRGTVDPSQ